MKSCTLVSYLSTRMSARDVYRILTSMPRLLCRGYAFPRIILLTSPRAIMNLNDNIVARTLRIVDLKAEVHCLSVETHWPP